MRKLTLVALAASAALIPAGAALAQVAGAPGPGPGQPAHPPGHSWQQGAPGMMRDGVRTEVRRQIGGNMHNRMGPGGRRFDHIRRIDRGGMVPHFWFGPQFTVRNWGVYGFPQPMHGRRWVRYYDDALLVDRDGRVHDGRYGMDWDRYGERWGSDDNGIPVYVGDGDYSAGEEDYEWVESHQGRGEHHGGGHGGYRQGGGYGHGGGFGYYGYGPMVVTETITTTTTAPVMETRTYYEYIEEEVRRPRVRRCKCAAPARPAPRPRAGERG